MVGAQDDGMGGADDCESALTLTFKIVIASGAWQSRLFRYGG